MNRLPRIVVSSGLMILVFIGTAITSRVVVAQVSDTPAKESSSEAEKMTSKPGKTPWISLSGKWKACEFGGEGEVTIKDGVIKMEYGDPLTGVRWEGPMEGDKPEGDSAKAQASDAPKKDAPKKDAEALPRDNYEIRWQCRRNKGFDFLCAFTFPVAEQHASLVMGGWGGGITGISSIDGRDASDNDTTTFESFDDDTWYNARVRVDKEKITVWIDETKLFDHPRKDHEFDIRFEMDPCTPLGIANFECESQIRKIQICRLSPTEILSQKKNDE